jgi:guanylate kinase
MTDAASSAQSIVRGTCSADIPAVWPYTEVVGERRGLLVVMSGPSGAGKDAVIDALARSGLPFTKVVTATTRSRRAGEVPGKDYHFLTSEEFYRWRDAGLLLEWAMVYGTPYGTPIAGVREALRAGETVLLKIDVQGAAQIKAKAPNAVFIYLGPGSFDELKQRLTRRKTESDDAYDRRIDQAREELLQVPHYEYLVVNRQGELDCAVEQVRSIILAERLRIHPRPIDVS